LATTLANVLSGGRATDLSYLVLACDTVSLEMAEERVGSGKSHFGKRIAPESERFCGFALKSQFSFARLGVPDIRVSGRQRG
jgi:hypothetical protein